MVEEHVQALIERVVKAELQSAHVVQVHVKRGEDFDGEDVIRITVVVDAPASSFDPRKLAALAGHLRDALADAAEFDFPMISYMNRREFDRVFA